MKTFTKDLLSKQPWGHSEPVAGKPRQRWEGREASVKGTGYAGAECWAQGAGAPLQAMTPQPTQRLWKANRKDSMQHGRGVALLPPPVPTPLESVWSEKCPLTGREAWPSHSPILITVAFIKSNNIRVLSFMKSCSYSLCILSSI